MNYKKIIFIIYIGIMNNTLFGQSQQFNYETEETKLDIESLLNKSKPLIDKLPTYRNFSTELFTMTKSNQAGVELIYEEHTPEGIELYRLKYAKMFETDKALADKKLILMCFIDKVLNPKSKKVTKAITIYVEHLNESKGYIYYYPYYKTLFGKVKFLTELNFRKETNKVFLN